MIIYLIVTLFGLLVGSFLNACIYRIPRDISVVKPRSFCPSCKDSLKFYENIPLVSYIFLKGKCGHCGKPISIRYPFIELLSAIITVFSYYTYGLSAEFVFYTVFLYHLIVVAFIDLEHTIIPNEVLLSQLVFAIVLNLVSPVIIWKDAVVGFFTGGIVLFIAAQLGNLLQKKESMGMGDVKFAAAVGFILGWKWILAALYIGFVFSLAGYLVLKIKNRLNYDKLIPLGPYLSLSFFVFLFWGETLINFYWNIVT